MKITKGGARKHAEIIYKAAWNEQYDYVYADAIADGLTEEEAEELAISFADNYAEKMAKEAYHDYLEE